MNLKIYRKLLVLCVLTIGLFFAVSSNKAEAQPCCPICDDQLEWCLDECGGPTTGERVCIQNCYAEYALCKSTFCPSCP